MRVEERSPRRSFSRRESEGEDVFIRENGKFYCMIVLFDRKCKFCGDFRKNSRNSSGVFYVSYFMEVESYT
jgi:hypothetical protein